LAWLDAHDRRFGVFIGGAWTKPGETFDSHNPATGEALAHVTPGDRRDVDAAVTAARRRRRRGPRPGHERARVLYALARLIQKHARLFAVLETLDNGKPIRESRDIDILWSRGISTITRAWRSFRTPSCPTARRWASAARSSRGTSRF
jgi:aldehyde dehydrogenase (NAD+)